MMIEYVRQTETDSNKTNFEEAEEIDESNTLIHSDIHLHLENSSVEQARAKYFL